MSSSVTFVLRSDTRQNWQASKAVLAKGEPGAETDTGQMKIGDGIKEWNDLLYVSTGSFANIVPPNSLIHNSTWLSGGANGNGLQSLKISGDGDTWRNVDLSGCTAQKYVYSLLWDGHQWLAGCDSNSGQGFAIIYSNDYGHSWNGIDSPFNNGICYGIAYNGSMYIAVGSNTTLTLSSASGPYSNATATGFIVEKVDQPKAAFKYAEDSSITRYYDSTQSAHTMYKVFSIKVVLLSNTTQRVPKIKDVRAVAVSV